MLTRPPALAALAALGTLAFAACGNESDGTFDREEFPFTFSYPEEFEETENITLNQELGATPDATAAIGVDDDNALLVQRFTLNLAIDESNLDRAKSEFEALVKQVDPEATARKTEIAGLPGLAFDELDVPSVEDGKSRLTVAFDGDQEYYLNCQFTPDERDRIQEACDLALETLKLK